MKLILRSRPEARVFTKSAGTVAVELVLHVYEFEFLSGKPKAPESEQLSLEAPSATKSKRRRAGGDNQ
jgi:hypothetical protein